jgi:hypothetical protein
VPAQVKTWWNYFPEKFGNVAGVALNIVSIVWLLIALPIMLKVIFGVWCTLFDSPNTNSAEALRWSILGLVGLVGIPFIAWRTQIFQQQTETGEKTLRNEQFVEAVKLLGATRDVVGEDGEKKTVPAIELRLGAIYALEKLSKDAPDEYFEMVMEILSAYVRDNTRHLRGFELTSENVSSTDIKTIFEVLCRRENQTYEIDLRGSCINISNADKTNIFDMRLDYAQIRMASCVDSKLRNLSLIGATITDTYFIDCTFGQGLFSAANLKEHLPVPTLSKVTFRHKEKEGALLLTFANVKLLSCKFELSKYWLRDGTFQRVDLGSNTIFYPGDPDKPDEEYSNSYKELLLNPKSGWGNSIVEETDLSKPTQAGSTASSAPPDAPAN